MKKPLDPPLLTQKLWITLVGLHVNSNSMPAFYLIFILWYYFDILIAGVGYHLQFPAWSRNSAVIEGAIAEGNMSPCQIWTPWGKSYPLLVGILGMIRFIKFGSLVLHILSFWTGWVLENMSSRYYHRMIMFGPSPVSDQNCSLQNGLAHCRHRPCRHTTCISGLNRNIIISVFIRLCWVDVYKELNILNFHLVVGFPGPPHCTLNRQSM
jgi:hypothetical protein